MKKNDIWAIIGLLLMFLKSNLFLIEGTSFYFYSNIFGASFFIIYLFINKRNKFIIPTIFYVGINLILELTESFQNQMLPVGSGLFLLLDISLFLFPIVAFLFYLKIFDGEEKAIKLSDRLMKVSLILALVGGFILLTGIFLSYSLIAISLITIVALVLEMLSLILVIFNFRNVFQR